MIFSRMADTELENLAQLIFILQNLQKNKIFRQIILSL